MNFDSVLSPNILIPIVHFAYLVSLFPVRRLIFYGTDYYGGILSNRYSANLIKGRHLQLVYPIWLLCAAIAVIAVSKPIFQVVAIFICLIFSRIFFIELRFKTIYRGCGAPGFMTYWILLYFFLIRTFEISKVDKSQLISLMLLDLSLIFWSAGIFKYRAGYLSGKGIEFGLANPMWCRNYRFIRIHLGPSVTKFLNLSAVIVEILISLLLIQGADILVFAGLFLLVIMFITLIPVRLGLLTLTMINIPFCIFLYLISIQSLDSTGRQAPGLTLIILHIYGVLLVFANIWNWLSFYSFPSPVVVRQIGGLCQRMTGAIIWSVFNANITENFVQVEFSQSRKKVQSWESPALRIQRNVHYNIMLANLALFPHYFPSLKDDFQDRVLAVCRYVSPYKNSIVRIRIFKLVHQSGNWSEKLFRTYMVDLKRNSVTIQENFVATSFSPDYFAVKATQKIGSYE
jgi:hypothetical protein